MMTYEDKSAQSEALRVVPVKELEDKAKEAFDVCRAALFSTPFSLSRSTFGFPPPHP